VNGGIVKRMIPYITVIMVVCALVWAFKYVIGVSPLSVQGRKPADFSIKFLDSTLVGWSNGKKAWTFHARTVQVSRDRVHVSFDGIAGGKLFENGRQLASLKAAKLDYDIVSGNVIMPKGAELAIVNGPVFDVKDVHWDSKSSRLYCKQGVDAVVNGNSFHGDRLTADIAKKEIYVEKVNGRLLVE